MRNRAAGVVITNLKTRYEQSFGRESALRSSFNQQRGETLTQNEAGINYHIIQQEIETNKNLLDGLLQRAKENDVAVAGMPNNINVVEHAIPSREPAGPQRLLGILLAAAIALVMGICLAIFLEYLDNTVRSAADVERMLRLPVLTVIPAVGRRMRQRLLSGKARASDGEYSRQDLLINREPNSTIAEAYKQLRTSILLSTAGHAPKSLLVTSGNPGEGKTTTAANVALSLAQTGARVLVVDADMRSPRIHTTFDITNVAGLSTALSRDVSEQDVLALIDLQEETGLHVMTSGPIPPNPAELLGSPQMKKLLETLSANFDHIVIDSPPIANITDGVLLATLVDGVVLVVHGGHSSRDLVKRARQLLRGVGARIFGVVLNNVKVHDAGYYYDYTNRYGAANTTHASLLSIAK
jgi:capsular exopolysaccharide synthesis family protein